jgi:hypothetical protein
MSPLSFTNTVREAMAPVKAAWNAKKLGTIIGSDDLSESRLCYIMFADDTTLVAKSKRAIKIMIKDIREALGTIGLNLNAEKCKVQTSDAKIREANLEVGEERFEIVRNDEGMKVLGTLVTLDGQTDVEFRARMRAAWAKFHSLKPLLCKKDASIQRRLRLFDATVSKTLLWCSESWALTVKQKKELQSVQRSMMRKIVNTRRRPEEDYITWIKRATKKASEAAATAGILQWQVQVAHKKWAWAEKVANMDRSRWAYRTTFWRDSVWTLEHSRGSSAHSSRPLRSRPGNRRRWEDDLRRFSTTKGWLSWSQIARTDVWANARDEFAQWYKR